MVLPSEEVTTKRNTANGAGNRRVLAELANHAQLSPSKVKALADEIVYKKGSRMPCSSFSINSDKTLNLGHNGILSIDGVENAMVRERVTTYLNEAFSKAEAARIRGAVLSVPTVPCASSAAHTWLHFPPKPLLFRNPRTVNQRIMSRLVENASHIPSNTFQQMVDAIVFWHFLETERCAMTHDCDGVVALGRGVVTIDDVPTAVVRKEVRKFVNREKLILKDSRSELFRNVFERPQVKPKAGRKRQRRSGTSPKPRRSQRLKA